MTSQKYPSPILSTVTIADVAKAAGVSIPTVSRILNNKPHVAQATKLRVLEAIETLGFVPHTQAKRLRGGKADNIALLFPLKQADVVAYNPLETEFILGAASAAGERGILFSLVTTETTSDSILNMYRSGQIDGLVLMQIHTNDWRVNLLRENGYPFVMIGRDENNDGISYIDLDFEATVIAAFDHLISLGHRDIGLIALPRELRESGFGPAIRGWRGYEKALQKHGIKALYRETDYAGLSIYQAAHDLLDENPDLTAIISTHELATSSIMQAFAERERSVPDDISLIALMPEKLGERTAPPLTQFDFPSYTMGYRAINLLLETLDGTLITPQHELIPPRLIVRQSTRDIHDNRHK